MLGKLASYIKEYKISALITPIFMILEVVFETLIPMILGKLVDNGISAGDMNYTVRMGAVMLALAVCGLASGIGGGVFAAKASTGFAKNLRKAMHDNIQTYSFSNIDKFSTAGLITRLTTDVTNVQNAFQMLLRMCFRAPFSMIISMVAAFAISTKISLIYLVAVVMLAGIITVIMLSAMKHFKEVFKKYDELNAAVQENVGAIRVVKAYVREEYEMSKFEKASMNIYRLFVKAENKVILNAPVMSITIYTCILLISWMGAHMIVGGNLTTGQLTSLLAYCMAILINLMMISMIFVMMSMSIASGERICEVLDEKADITNPENPVMNVTDGSIEFENVSFSYKSNAGDPVLKDISIRINSGETIGIIGGTGSAKSSLVNLISRLYDVNEGCVRVGGTDVREYDLTTLRDQVSVVLQKNVLFSGTILENLRWGKKDATYEECVHACKLACADDFISKMPDKYDTYIEQGGSNVSGGQKQRLCIARALLKSPKILILDDSTSAVDTATDARIQKALKEDVLNTTKIIIAQRISSVQHADRIIVMENGRINGIGTHEELLASNEIYREVYEEQVGGSHDFDEAKGGNK